MYTEDLLRTALKGDFEGYDFDDEYFFEGVLLCGACLDVECWMYSYGSIGDFIEDDV